MNHEFDTPPNGDFVRYLERMTSPSPGAVKPVFKMMVQEKVAAAATAATAATARTARSARTASSAPATQGPPDLGTILRQVASQIATEFRKNSNRR